MGIFTVKVKIKGRNGELERELIADSGSTFTWIKREVLESIGIVPKRRKKIILITGEKFKRDVGEALIEIEGETAIIPVVFAEKSDKEVLGSTALKILGFKIDPIEKKLKKVEAFLAL